MRLEDTERLSQLMALIVKRMKPQPDSSMLDASFTSEEFHSLSVLASALRLDVLTEKRRLGQLTGEQEQELGVIARRMLDEAMTGDRT